MGIANKQGQITSESLYEWDRNIAQVIEDLETVFQMPESPHSAVSYVPGQQNCTTFDGWAQDATNHPRSRYALNITESVATALPYTQAAENLRRTSDLNGNYTKQSFNDCLDNLRQRYNDHEFFDGNKSILLCHTQVA